MHTHAFYMNSLEPRFKMATFDDIPEEIKFTIFCMTTARDIPNIRQVCKSFMWTLFYEKRIREWIVLQKKHDLLVANIKPKTRSHVKVSPKWKQFLIDGKAFGSPQKVSSWFRPISVHFLKCQDNKMRLPYEVNAIIPPTHDTPAHYENHEAIKNIYANTTQILNRLYYYMHNNRLCIGSDLYVIDHRLAELSKSYKVGDIITINGKYKVFDHFNVTEY